jgi:hypothetical protein
MFHAKFADRDTLREAAEHRRAGVELEGRPGTTSWRFGGDTMVSLLDKIAKKADLDAVKPFEPTPALLEGIVREEEDTFRARGGRQVPAMKKAELVLIPERFRGIV